MGASVGANRRRGGSDGGKGRIQDRVKGGGRNQRGRGGGCGRGIGRGATRSSGGTEKAEDSETEGVGLAQEGGVGGGGIVSRI